MAGEELGVRRRADVNMTVCVIWPPVKPAYSFKILDRKKNIDGVFSSHKQCSWRIFVAQKEFSLIILHYKVPIMQLIKCQGKAMTYFKRVLFKSSVILL